MIQNNQPRRNFWKAAIGLFLLGFAMAAPQAAFAGDKKDKDVPIVVGKPIVTDDKPKK